MKEEDFKRVSKHLKYAGIKTAEELQDLTFQDLKMLQVHPEVIRTVEKWLKKQ